MTDCVFNYGLLSSVVISLVHLVCGYHCSTIFTFILKRKLWFLANQISWVSD